METKNGKTKRNNTKSKQNITAHPSSIWHTIRTQSSGEGHTSKQHKVTLMWVYGWNKNLDNPETHLKEKYFGGRNRKGMNYPLDKNEIKKKIKASYKEHKLGGGIKQEEFNAKDAHLSNNAFLIGTFATYK